MKLEGILERKSNKIYVIKLTLRKGSIQYSGRSSRCLGIIVAQNVVDARISYFRK